MAEDDDTYDEALTHDGRNLVMLAKAGTLKAVDFREAEIAAVLEHFDRARSVLLVGPTGVGKTSVLHGVAHAIAARGEGAIFEFSTIAMFSGTRYLGEWQTKLTRIANAAAESGAILFISDIWNLPKAGKTSQSDSNLLDALRPFVESGRVRLVAEASPETLRAMQRVQGFVRLFQMIDVAPMSETQVDATLARVAERRGTQVDEAGRRALVKLTSRFLAARPQPGPARTVLEQVIDYQEQKRAIGEHEAISPAFIERVFAINSGLPPFVVSRGITMPAADIRAWFSERIVGQRAAVEAVVETIALFKAGLNDPTKPIGSFLFVGPTGVGKTEIARALATFVFGSAQRLLRFDLSEFKDYSSFEMMMGSLHAADKPARLLDPVRAHPFQVVLFDELEKAHPNVWDLLLPLLDEGRLTAPNGETVDFRNTVIIATSNAGAQEATKSMGFGAAGEGDRIEARTRAALERDFRPEFLNRFQHVVVFHALSKVEMRTVARQEMQRVLGREGIAGESLVVDVDDAALDLVIAQGLDARYGARALKREVQRRIVLPLAMTLMEREVLPGSILKVAAKDDQLKIRVVETESSRAHRAESEPARSEGGRVLSRQEMGERCAKALAQIDELGVAVDVTKLGAERDALAEQRNAPDFWKNAAAAERVQRELDRVQSTLDRLQRLHERAAVLEAALPKANARAELEKVSTRVRTLEAAVVDARRELVLLGWDGSPDAIVEVRPVGGSGREARDLLVEVYGAWAAHRRMALEWIREPRADDEPAMVLVKGLYASGMLRGEAGLHRVRLAAPEGKQGRLVVAGVRVAPWLERKVPFVMSDQRPLKITGQYGGKIRSRIACDGGLVLQNARTLAENRELAAELVASWAAAPPSDEQVVRRYDREPPRLRDARTGFTSGRPDALAAPAFDLLLRACVDARGDASGGDRSV